MFHAASRQPITMEDIVTLTILGTFIAFLVLDSLRPARAQPELRFWRLTGVAFFVVYSVVATLSPLLWTELLAEHRLIDASALGLVPGVIIGLLALDLASFAWHYALHHVQFLWRWFHQVHHSAERIDTAGAFYFSPLDMIGFTFATSFALVFVVGVSAEASIIANGAATLLAMFQHANLRTPAWLGYLVQRPEAHNLHHGRDVHGFNYGSLAIWDLVFGTWRNPATWTGKNGLFDGSTRRLGAMLVGRDVAAERAAARGVDELPTDSHLHPVR
jgi:sterol desaturase/sphingolipid hydroxylase (fatty acid hydroxylase superfamily)